MYVTGLNPVSGKIERASIAVFFRRGDTISAQAAVLTKRCWMAVGLSLADKRTTCGLSVDTALAFTGMQAYRDSQTHQRKEMDQ